MVQGKTLFLKAAIFPIGIIVLCLCIFWLPWLANKTAEMNMEYAYLQYPVLIGLYLTTIPFFIALYHAFKLITYIEQNNVFSGLSIKSLNDIKYCAGVISILYVLGMLFLLSQNALHPGIAIIGLTILFASVVIAAFSCILQKLCKKAIAIKLENDFTI